MILDYQTRAQKRAQAIREYKNLIQSLSYLRGTIETIAQVKALKADYNL